MSKKQVTLKIKGKNYIFPYGLYFLGECLENLGLSPVEIGDKLDQNSFKWIPRLMHESHKIQCDIEGKEVDFTIFELVETLDNKTGKANLAKFYSAFIKSLMENVPREESTTKQSDSKKK